MINLNKASPQRCGRINFARINDTALSILPALLRRWLPRGKIKGDEYVARNPRRADRNLGSFKVNLTTGRWCDFATGDCGGDPIALAAFLAGTTQVEAAEEVANMLGVEARDA